MKIAWIKSETPRKKGQGSVVESEEIDGWHYRVEGKSRTWKAERIHTSGVHWNLGVYEDSEDAAYACWDCNNHPENYAPRRAKLHASKARLDKAIEQAEDTAMGTSLVLRVVASEEGAPARGVPLYRDEDLPNREEIRRILTRSGAVQLAGNVEAFTQLLEALYDLIHNPIRDAHLLEQTPNETAVPVKEEPSDPRGYISMRDEDGRLWFCGGGWGPKDRRILCTIEDFEKLQQQQADTPVERSLKFHLLTPAEVQEVEKRRAQETATVQALQEKLLPYISIEDAVLTDEEFFEVVADRIKEDLDFA